MQAEDRFEDRAVQPGGRAGVPRPAAAADVGRPAVDVAGDDVGLDLVALDALRVLGVADRVEDRQQLGGAAGRSPSCGERLHDPGGRVRVLAAVLADARQVALDVAGVDRLGVERRGEQEDQPVLRGRPAVSSTASIARGRAPGRPAPESTAQDCAIESIWQAAFRAEPSGVPSSKYARRYQSPSQALASTAAAQLLGARRGRSAARVESPRPRPGRRTGGTRRSRTRPARRSRPCRRRRRGSCRRSSRRCPSAAGRAAPDGRTRSRPGGNARRACRRCAGDGRQAVVVLLLGLQRRAP